MYIKNNMLSKISYLHYGTKVSLKIYNPYINKSFRKQKFQIYAAFALNSNDASFVLVLFCLHYFKSVKKYTNK